MKTKINNIVDDVFNIEVENKKSLKVVLCNKGASLRHIYLKNELITLSPKDDLSYLRLDNYFGKTIGRTAGRIKNATYKIGDKVAKLEVNENTNNLHSGKTGLHQKVFKYEIVEGHDFTDIIFKTDLTEGEGGHIGSGSLDVCYRVYDNLDTFEIVYHAKANDDMFLNLTNHVYLNLSGNFKTDILNEILYINGTKYGSFDSECILDNISKAPKIYNFKHKHKVGKFINDPTVQKVTKGYDNPYYLDEINYDKPCASLYDKLSKNRLNIYTTLPICHLYTNNFPSDYEVIDGIFDKKHSALCLECEYEPNGINRGLTEGIIKKGESQTNTIKYEFIVR